ncbi:MAG: DUF3253 domain-containing protein [Acidobacteriota bacterium]
MAEPRSADRGEKTCAVCGRRMEWRSKWARNWDAVRYCGERCRRRRLTTVDHRLEGAILDLLASRAGGATICPSEAARAVAPEDWRPLMERTRSAARRLAAAGRVDVLQRGRRVDPSTAKGPTRLRRTDR